MKKSTTVILLSASILLVCAAVVAVVVDGNLPLAKTAPASNTSDRLMAAMGVSLHPFDSDPLKVKLLNIAGRYVHLEDFKGKIVFLNFWTTWCPTCITEMPSMEKLHRKLSGQNFVMAAVNIQESAAEVKDFFEKNKLTFTALLDTTGEVSAEFGIRAIPATFILDKNGKIIGSIAGPREWDGKKSVAMFEHLAKN